MGTMKEQASRSLHDDGRFDIRFGRAMVSLGPLSSKRYCTYACAFCYVHSGFQKYPSWPVDRIVEFCKEHRAEFDIVYVSGDTDSFAPPRTEKGLQLLEGLESLDCDLLFTTRAPLQAPHFERLARLNRRFVETDRLLIGCISISRLRSASHLEPKPVPAPTLRISILENLKAKGLVTVLALRPFLPVVPPEEYVELVGLCASYVDLVLGEVWYADEDGLLEEKVLGPKEIERREIQFERHEMDFDSNEKVWKVWAGREVEQRVREACTKREIPFFMRSRPAIDYLRSKKGIAPSPGR